VSRDALLARLARLDEQDRAWLLGELPPDLRRELLTGLDENEPPVAAEAPVAAGWESLDAQSVARIMEPEPAWLLSAATRNAEARWRAHLLQHLPARRRSEIEHADRSGRALNTRANRLLIAECRARIAAGTFADTRAPLRGGFAALVDQMRSRFA
jgi:hypothetical protein